MKGWTGRGGRPREGRMGGATDVNVTAYGGAEAPDTRVPGFA
jgi:hypothetical protein